MNGTAPTGPILRNTAPRCRNAHADACLLTAGGGGSAGSIKLDRAATRSATSMRGVKRLVEDMVAFDSGDLQAAGSETPERKGDECLRICVAVQGTIAKRRRSIVAESTYGLHQYLLALALPSSHVFYD